MVFSLPRIVFHLPSFIHSTLLVLVSFPSSLLHFIWVLAQESHYVPLCSTQPRQLYMVIFLDIAFSMQYTYLYSSLGFKQIRVHITFIFLLVGTLCIFKEMNKLPDDRFFSVISIYKGCIKSLLYYRDFSLGFSFNSMHCYPRKCGI